MSITPTAFGTTVHPLDIDAINQASTEGPNSPIAESSSARRGSRTVNACEQCQRRKTKCTGQPSPCEACEKIGLNCRFDSKTNWKSRSRATYSAEDGRLQHLLNAVLNALKHSDERTLDGLMTALRQNESPENVAMHLRNNMTVLQEDGHISNMIIDQTDLVSLASRITNPVTSVVLTSGLTHQSDVYPHAVDTSPDTSRFEKDGIITDVEPRMNTEPTQISNSSSWTPGLGLQIGQHDSYIPWSQVQNTSIFTTQSDYYYDQQSNFLPDPILATSQVLHQPYYSNPYVTANPVSLPPQYFSTQQNPQLSSAAFTSRDFTQLPGGTGDTSSTLFNESLTVQALPGAPSQQPALSGHDAHPVHRKGSQLVETARRRSKKPR